MAEKIKEIELRLNQYQYGLENHLITQKEYNELASVLSSELHQLAQNI